MSDENLLAAASEPDEPGTAARQGPWKEARPSPGSAAVAHPSSRRRLLVLSAGAALLALALPVSLISRDSWRASTPDRPPTQVHAVTFPPPARGGGERRLPGPGPWLVAVVMPFGAAPGDYRVRIQRDGSAIAPVQTTAGTTPDGTLTLIIDSLDGPGRYSMVIEPTTPAAGARYVYPFEVVPAQAPAPPR